MRLCGKGRQHNYVKCAQQPPLEYIILYHAVMRLYGKGRQHCTHVTRGRQTNEWLPCTFYVVMYGKTNSAINVN